MTASRSFDGTSAGNVLVTRYSAIDNVFSGGGTCCAWININSSGENERGSICAKTAGSNSASPTSGWGFNIRTQSATDRIQFFNRFSVGLGVWYTDGALTANTWYFVAVTYDSDSSSNDPTIYIDESSQTLTEAVSPTVTYNSDASNDFYIGDTLNSDREFDGEICHLHLYDTVLSIDQIKELRYKPGSIRSNLQLYIPVMGADSPERNLSGVGGTGTVTGTTSVAEGPPITKFL